MTPPDDATIKAQAWQHHRMLCVELAAKCGATPINIVKVARRIDAFIVIKTELEKGAKG
jgi:hypothetical protein